MTSKVFIDTNILIYALDSADKKKQKKAQAAIKECANNNNGTISTQILQEFFVTATKKLGFDAVTIKTIARTFSRFEIITVSPSIIESAIDCSVINKLSFWDSLMISTAESARCTQLLTEDLTHNQHIQTVTIKNPFLS